MFPVSEEIGMYKAITTGIRQKLVAENVDKVYSGRQGCMCGCRGKYTTPELNARHVTRVLNTLKDDVRAVIQGGYILCIDHTKLIDGERNYVVYFKQGKL